MMYLLIYFIDNVENDAVFVIGKPFDKKRDLLYIDFIESFKKHKNISIDKDKTIYFGNKDDDSDWAYFIKLIT